MNKEEFVLQAALELYRNQPRGEMFCRKGLSECILEATMAYDSMKSFAPEWSMEGLAQTKREGDVDEEPAMTGWRTGE